MTGVKPALLGAVQPVDCAEAIGACPPTLQALALSAAGQKRGD